MCFPVDVQPKTIQRSILGSPFTRDGVTVGIVQHVLHLPRGEIRRGDVPDIPLWVVWFVPIHTIRPHRAELPASRVVDSYDNSS